MIGWTLESIEFPPVKRNRQSNAVLERREPRPNRGDGATDRACWITHERKDPSQPFHVRTLARLAS